MPSQQKTTKDEKASRGRNSRREYLGHRHPSFGHPAILGAPENIDLLRTHDHHVYINPDLFTLFGSYRSRVSHIEQNSNDDSGNHFEFIFTIFNFQFLVFKQKYE
jgi:hypothetical protein